MNKSNLNLFLEINNFDFTFFVGEVDEQNLFKSSYQNIRCELNNLNDIEEFCNNDILHH